MEEKIEKIIEKVTKEIEDYSHLERYQMLDELAGRLMDMGDMELKLEYMLEETEDE